LYRRPVLAALIVWIPKPITTWLRWQAVRDGRGMGRPSPAYVPKAPAQRVLHQVVRDHFETFRAEAARVYERDALPRFIEEEFRGFLRPFDRRPSRRFSSVEMPAGAVNNPGTQSRSLALHPAPGAKPR
jgi:hypothetical protein